MFSKKNLFIAGLFLAVVMFFGVSEIAEHKLSMTEWDGTQYNIENINALDASMAQPYSEKFDDLGTYFCAFSNFFCCIICFLVPFIAALRDKKSVKKVFFDFFVFVETWICTRAVYSLLKTAMGRIRPYMYFPNPSAKGIEECDFDRSWPSGHTSTAFLAFGFMVGWFVFDKTYGKSKKFWILVEAVICAVTGVLRILSGNHFFTDVLTGAVLGSVVGFAVSFVNLKLVSEDKD